MERMRVLVAGGLGALSLALVTPAHAQEIAEQVDRAPDGVVAMSFPSRPGVCGYGEGIGIRDAGTGEGTSFIRWKVRKGDPDWQSRCTPGPVRVELRVRDGQVTAVRTFVGEGAGRVERDLGSVSAAAAVRYLLGLAARAPEKVGEDAILPVVLAEGVDVRPELLRLAADESVPEGTREKAVFWAAERGASTAELARVFAGTGNREVKEQILFAYSRQKEPRAAQELLRVARSESEPTRVRKKAVFWLGHAAGRAVARDLEGVVESEAEDVEVKEHAVFALSRRPADEAVPALIRIARENPSPRLRKKALFWLGETGDPRAIAFFEELLTQR